MGDRGGSSAPRSPAQAFRLLPLGLGPLDRILGGGLALGALHEIRSVETRAVGAAHGFAAALAASIANHDRRPFLWVSEAGAAREAGIPFGPGLLRFGLDPGRLITVRVDKPGEALWVFEEALRCAGLAAVIAEVHGNPAILDLTASRRLALRARESAVTGFLLREGSVAEPGAALTRWCALPRPAEDAEFSSGVSSSFLGRPAWRLRLERNRLGRTGSIDLEWHHAERAFREPVHAPAALPVAPPAIPVDRPDRAAGERTRLAFVLPGGASAGRHRREGKKRAAAGGA